MLSYALAIAVATSSLVLFLTAFLMSDIHRKDDFFWSGVGLFYALVLWYCAKNITGSVLLGQAAATALLVSYSWQTLKLRRAIANPEKAAQINNFSVVRTINGWLKRDRPNVKSATPPAETPITPKVTEAEIAIPDAASQDSPQAAPKATEAVDTNISVADTKQNESATIKEPIDQTTSKVRPQAAAPAREAIDNSTSNIKSIDQPTSSQQSEDNSTQDEIVKSAPVTSNTPKVVVRDEPAAKLAADDLESKTASSIKPEAKTESSTTTGDRQQAETVEKEIKPEPEITPTTVEPVKKPSSLDSLETVEVAEVLDATEDSTINLDTDRSNIIEVTTTEINITTEVKTVEQDEEDTDFKEA